QRPRRAIPQIRPEFVREFREERDIALLTAFGMRDQEHLLVKIHLGHLHLHKLRYPGSGLEQCFNEGSVSKVEMESPRNLIYKVLFPSISTFETPPAIVAKGRQCVLRPFQVATGHIIQKQADGFGLCALRKEPTLNLSGFVAG